MRMRKKKNLENRVDSCNNLLRLLSEDRNFDTAISQKEYIDFEKIFGNTNPVQMEIGCGKGQFIATLAAQNPDINYIAVEKSINVIVDACEKCKEQKNVIFLCGCAEYLTKYIKPEYVTRIYLNFSCPFPKKSYANHRLTSERFLKIYKNFL